MAQFKIFAGMCMFAVATAFGFWVFGWWMLVPCIGGVLWNIAGNKAQSAAQALRTESHPSHVASQPSKPASTVTWQETVEAIERARPGKVDQA